MPQLRRTFLANQRFRRDTGAPFVDATGAVVTAGPGEPRFDHDPDTLEPIGLLIDTRDGAVAADHVLPSMDQAWAYEAVGKVCTVFFDWKPKGGVRQQQAFYTSDPAALVAVLERRAGHIRRITVKTKQMPAVDGLIAWKHLAWTLVEAGLLLVAADTTLDIGDGDHLETEPSA